MSPFCSLRSVRLMPCLGNVMWKYIQNLFLEYIYIFLDVLQRPSSKFLSRGGGGLFLAP